MSDFDFEFTKGEQGLGVELSPSPIGGNSGLPEVDLKDGINLDAVLGDDLVKESATSIARDMEARILNSFKQKKYFAVSKLKTDANETASAGDLFISDKVTGSYAKAVSAVPALRAYTAIASYLADNPEAKDLQVRFTAADDGSETLGLLVSKPLYSEIIAPQMKYLRPEDFADSKIEKALYAISKAFNASSANVQKQKAGEQQGRFLEEKGFSPEDMMVERDTLTSLFNDVVELEERTADMSLEMDMFGNEALDTSGGNLPFEVSMIDLSNKAIAEFFIDTEKTRDEVRAQLTAEKFPKNRIEEIVGIYNYLKLNKAMAKKSTATGIKKSSMSSGANLDIDF